jgi:hypothetical protein
MKSVKFTRQQLLDAECTHQQYYEQFLSPLSVQTVIENIGADRILKSTHPYFSDSGIDLSEWELIGSWLPANFRAVGDWRTISGDVCLAKAAANLYRRQFNNPL